MVGVYNKNKSYVGEQELYQFMSMDEFLENFLSAIEEFCNLSKYSSTITLPHDYHPDLYTSKFPGHKGVAMYH